MFGVDRSGVEGHGVSRLAISPQSYYFRGFLSWTFFSRVQGCLWNYTAPTSLQAFTVCCMLWTANHVERRTTTLYFPARTTDGYSRLPRNCARRHVDSGRVDQCDRVWRWLGDGGKMRWRLLAPNSGEGPCTPLNRAKDNFLPSHGTHGLIG